MRRVFSVTSAAAFALVLVAPVFAAEMTIKGELVDRLCYRNKGKVYGAGAAHASCAQDCAKKGQQVALLTADGIYLVAGELAKENNAKLVPHMSHTVELTGDVTEKDGVKTIAAIAIKMVSR